MRPRMLLGAMVLFTITGSWARAQPAQATAAIMVRNGQALLVAIAPYNPHMDDVRDSPADKDGYAWEFRDTANRVVRKGRASKTTELRSEWDANGRPDPKVLEVPALALGVVVPNVSGTLVIYDTKAGADTGPQLATLRLPIVPAGAVVCVTISGALDCDP